MPLKANHAAGDALEVVGLLYHNGASCNSLRGVRDMHFCYSLVDHWGFQHNEWSKFYNLICNLLLGFDKHISKVQTIWSGYLCDEGGEKRTIGVVHPIWCVIRYTSHIRICHQRFGRAVSLRIELNLSRPHHLMVSPAYHLRSMLTLQILQNQNETGDDVKDYAC